MQRRTSCPSSIGAARCGWTWRSRWEKWGSFYASARQQSYWGSDRKDKLVQVGYSGSYGRVGYNIFYSQVSNLRGPANRQVMLTLSIPLGSNVNASYAVSRNNQGRVTHQAGVSGSAWDDFRLTYGLTVDRSNEDGSNGSANLNYKGRSGQVNLSHSQGKGYGQTNISVAGGLVAHGEGVTLSQPWAKPSRSCAFPRPRAWASSRSPA